TENGVRLMVGHLLRLDPRYVQLHQQIEAGNLGELLHIRVKRQNPNIIHDRLKGRTSMLYYVGIHDIDAMLWCMHEEPVEVYAKRVAKVHTEDCIFILCSFRNGTVGTLEFSWSLPKSFPTGIWSELEVVGTKGAASIDNLDQGLKLCTDKYSIPDTYLWSKYNGRRLGDIREESIHFIDAVLHNKDFLMPVGDAIKSVAFIEACFESIAAGIPIKIKAGENV
ncbi:MAG: Gfo/Idh/MocA family oxidoreductase, partial [Victivallales bacterium]